MSYPINLRLLNRQAEPTAVMQQTPFGAQGSAMPISGLIRSPEQNPRTPTYLPGDSRFGIFGSPMLRPSSPAARMGENTTPPDGGPLALPLAGGNSQPANGPNITDLAPNVRRSFDYEGATDAILGKPEKQSPWKSIAAVLGPALMAASGNQQGANMFINSMNQRRQHNQQFRQDVIRDLVMKRLTDAQASDEAYYRDTAPFSSGRDRLRWDPETNQTAMLHKGEQDFEAYANALDLVPGSDEYFNAVEDYVLRANGPAAFERNKQIDDYRTGNDLRIEGARQNNRVDLEGIRQGNRVNLRQTPTYRDTHGAPARQSSSRASSAPTATDANGNTVRWDGKQWVPVK